MTTAGRVVQDRLGKAQCRRCGNVQKVFAARLADTDFYEERYTYYDRVGAQVLDEVRYRALAEWVVAALRGRTPRRILDVGCGQGATLAYLKEAYPKAELVGLEPSTDAVRIARANGLNVHQGRLGQTVALDGAFDLVFSNNVLQHTTDPIEFLELQKGLLTTEGELVVSCPDGTEPNIELLMADQNVSMRPRHVAQVAASAGFAVIHSLPCPGGPLRNEQLVVLRPAAAARSAIDVSSDVIAAEAAGLTAYIDNWARLDDYLCDAVAGARRVLNFGGGLWSYALAAYCPRYWGQVETCVVDRFTGQCQGRDVIPLETAGVTPDDVLVLGTNPYVQTRLVRRFESERLRAVAFSAMIPH